MRDRLIELLCDIECKGEDFRNGGCAFRKDERCIKIDNLDMCMIGCIADNLLANGVIVPPCKVGDYVHFKGLEDPWKVSTINFYAEGAPKISITSKTGKITTTMTLAEFSEFAVVITDEKAEKALAERSEP
jgi:hypothetical protein